MRARMEIQEHPSKAVLTVIRIVTDVFVKPAEAQVHQVEVAVMVAPVVLVLVVPVLRLKQLRVLQRQAMVQLRVFRYQRL